MPTVWIHPVSYRLGKILLGPDIRALQIAKKMTEHGYQVKIVLQELDRSLPVGVEGWLVPTRGSPKPKPGDIEIVNPFLPVQFLWKALRGRSRIVSDFYSVGLPEFLEEESLHTSRTFRVQRRRIWIRYAWLARRAERCLFSTKEQMAFLAGGLSNDKLTNSRLASVLPAKSILAPMGFDPNEFQSGSENPYPGEIQNRPIFLWGGGIWPWLNLSPLVQAFKILHDQGSNAVLFFLSGVPVGNSKRLRSPVDNLLGQVKQLGLLNKSIFFNPHTVQFEKRMGYLEHCHAGILSNPASIESSCSWRTRLLDLLMAGKTAVVAGDDPLSDQLFSLEAIVKTNRDPHEIAKAIIYLCEMRNRLSFERRIKEISDRYTWDRSLEAMFNALLAADDAQKNLFPSYWELQRFLRPF